MPNYRLRPGEEIPVPSRPLHARAWDTRSGQPVGLRAERAPGAPVDAWYPNPELMVVPAVPGPVVVRVVPPNAAAFSEDVTVSVHLQAAPAAGLEAVDVVLEAFPVSGRARPEVVYLEPDGTGVRVRAAAAAVDEPATGLAARVGAEVRRRLGTDEIPPERRASLVVGVDVSGSMRGPLEDGSVAALIEAVTGVARVVGDGGPLRTVLLGRRPRWLPADSDPATAVPAEIRRSGLGIGFRPSVANIAPGPGRTVVYLLTDADPPDSEPPQPGVERHVVIAGAADGDPIGGHGRTVLEPPPAGVQATDHLLSAQSAAHLTELVSSLVTSWTDDREEGAVR